MNDDHTIREATTMITQSNASNWKLEPRASQPSRQRSIWASLLFLTLMPFAAHGKCGSDEYRDSVTHLCVPKGPAVIRQVIQIDQAAKAIALATTIASGDSKKIKQG